MIQHSTITPIWTIVERFYRTYHLYERQYQRYESKVAEYVQREGKPREQIRLDAMELHDLLDFKQLEDIRDFHVTQLKDACHQLFRRDDSTDLLDRLVNDIFHELSILKEEHYNIMTYDAHPTEQDNVAEQQAILDEVHEMFPIKVHRLRHLFDRARRRVERILPAYRAHTVLTRSLFLHRAGFVARAYPDGLLRFYRILHGDTRAFQGYVRAGDSFFDSGFFEHAAACYSAGEEHLKSIAPVQKRQLHPEWKAARDHFKRRLRECHRRLAELEDY